MTPEDQEAAGDPRTAAGQQLRTFMLYHNSNCPSMDDYFAVTDFIRKVEDEAAALDQDRLTKAIHETLKTRGHRERVSKGMPDECDIEANYLLRFMSLLTAQSVVA